RQAPRRSLPERQAQGKLRLLTSRRRLLVVDPQPAPLPARGAFATALPMSSPPDTPSPSVDRKAAAWGRPFARLDAAWTRFESLLCVGVLIAEILALCLWIALKGLSTPTDAGNAAGLVFRSVLGAIVLGLVAFLVTRQRSLT